MFNRKWMILSSLVIVLTMVLSACQPAAAPTPETITIIETVEVEVEGETVIQEVEKVITATPAPEEVDTTKTLRLYVGQEWPSIDPAFAWDVSGITIVEETSVGLTRQNEENAQVELGMATDYTASEDGLTYTFTLRDDVPWVRWDAVNKEVVTVKDCEGNDRYVTAQDFEYSIKRIADPETAAGYAFLLGWVVQGAEDYTNGVTDDPETIAVKAIDDTTLEVSFVENSVYNLSVMGLWFTHAVPQWKIEGDECTEAVGERWVETGFNQSYGPFVMTEWIHDASMTLVKNPFWPGTDSVPAPAIDVVQLSVLTASSALAEFEAGNLDVVGIPASDYDRIMADPDYSQWLFPSNTLGTEFYSLNTTLAPTDDVRVRQALSMAIDRDALVTLNKSGIPAAWFTHPGAVAAPQVADYPDLGVKYDPEGAKALLDEYLAEKGLTAEELNITLMFNTSEGHKMRAEVVQQMWKNVLGIDVQLTNQEWAVFRESRKTGAEHIYRSSWVQDYPDAKNFLWDVFSSGSGSYVDVVNWGDTENHEKFDELCAEANVEADPVVRTELHAQAEEILVVDEAVVIPLYWYSDQVIVRPEVKAVESVTGYDRWEKWDVLR